jgi:predicted NUDIX family NTP pyrophosphohydrolase
MLTSTSRPRISAGVLLYRSRGRSIEVLLAHPGGPRNERKDHGHWTIPKGEPDEGEDLELVARREFAEETGMRLEGVPLTPLGETRQKGGKLVHAWAAEGDLDPAAAVSNTFPATWPPGSGHTILVPEIDRVAWFDPDEARARIKDAQAVFIDRLEAALAAGSRQASGPA